HAQPACPAHPRQAQHPGRRPPSAPAVSRRRGQGMGGRPRTIPRSPAGQGAGNRRSAAPQRVRALLQQRRRCTQDHADHPAADARADSPLRIPGVLQRCSAHQVFRQPFAMADTADRSPEDRHEQHGRRKEEWGRQGYRNDFEAALIAQLVTEYVRWYPDWAVIVPYRAQVERVTELLTQSLGGNAAVADSVGTVDAFQGGERDLIIYGFTRSNDSGDIGFLKELRRL